MLKSKTLHFIMLHYIKEFEDREGYFVQDASATKFFHKYPLNDEMDNVILKVNDVGDMDFHAINASLLMAQHIMKIDNLDARLANGDWALVNEIANFDYFGQKHYLGAFASKFCNLHFPNLYPIYDKLIIDVLTTYMAEKYKSSITIKDLQDYVLYSFVLKDFLAYIKFSTFNYKQIDQFFWLYRDAILKELKG